MREPWRVELLGGLCLRRGESVITHFRTRKTGGLLAYLAYFRQRQHPREKLIDLLWPESDLDAGRQSLSRALTSLRQQLEPAGTPSGSILLADRSCVGLNPEAVTTDVVDFEAALAAAEQASDPADRRRFLTIAVESYHGDLLPSYYDDWVLQNQERLAGLHVQALMQIVPLLEQCGDLSQALEYARRAAAADPLREEAHINLMRLYCATGQLSAAQRQYRRMKEALDKDLGTEPSPTTVALAKQILSAAPQISAQPAGRSPGPSSERGEGGPPPRLSPAYPAQPSGPLPEPHRPHRASHLPGDEGENRLVTVIVTSNHALPATNAADLGEVAALISRLLNDLSEILRGYGGAVDRFPGGRFMALFGATQAREDDPLRALQAALDVTRVAEELGLGLSVGVCTGQAYVTGIDREQGSHLMVIGQAIEDATQMAEMGAAGQILVTESTYQSSHGAFEFEPTALTLGRSTQPTALYSLRRALPNPGRIRSTEGLRAPLVGRRKELSRLRSAAQKLLAGSGQLACVVGDAGVGKTRLVAELRDAVEDGESGPLWLEGRSAQQGATAVARVLLDLQRTFAPELVEADPMRRGRWIATFLETLSRQGAAPPNAAETIGPVVEKLLEARFGTAWDSRLDSAGDGPLRRQMLTALRDLFAALAQQRPLVLVFDDLHWADSFCLDLLTLLLDALRSSRILLICIYRLERGHRCCLLRRLAHQQCPDRFTDLHLSPLNGEDSRELLAELLDRAPVPPSVERGVLARTGGNPLFLEEILQALVTSGRLRREGELWTLEGDGPLSVPIPDRLQRLILSRVDRLTAPAKQVCQLAAVAGHAFRRDLLSAALPDPHQLEEGLWELEDQSLIYRSAVLPEEEYSFHHILTQEVVYQSLGGHHRKQLHLRVAQAIEHLYGASLFQHSELLAYHYSRAGDEGRASEYARAAEKMRGRQRVPSGMGKGDGLGSGSRVELSARDRSPNTLVAPTAS